MISGILAIDKPQGCTSHDVVARVRRIAGQREVGHAGTLDPLASGLLLIVLGQATRLAPYLTDTQKTYIAEIVLGATTATDDAEATLLRHAEVTDLSASALTGHLQSFIGTIQQTPPAYAAIKIGGERMYRLARKGEQASPVPRTVTIHEITVQHWKSPRLRVLIRCGAGTYIRALARDLGEALGCGGYLHGLRRVESGTFHVDRAVCLHTLDRATIIDSVAPLDRAVMSWPAALLDDAQANHVLDGRVVYLGTGIAGNVRLYGPSGELVALARCTDGSAQPFRVFARRSPLAATHV